MTVLFCHRKQSFVSTLSSRERFVRARRALAGRGVVVYEIAAVVYRALLRNDNAGGGAFVPLDVEERRTVFLR